MRLLPGDLPPLQLNYLLIVTCSQFPVSLSTGPGGNHKSDVLHLAVCICVFEDELFVPGHP